MRNVRWGIVIVLICLALVMKAPVWFLIARVDFVGGHGWDRAFLVDQFIRHVPNWFLVGSNENAGWGYDTWDACNQFVAEGLAGGMATFVLFLTILSRGFSMIGKARKQVEGDRLQEWFFWCIGTALFVHLIEFLGIDYFDQTKILWFAFLAMISAATAAPFASPAVADNRRPQVEFEDFMLAGGPAAGWLLSD